MEPREIRLRQLSRIWGEESGAAPESRIVADPALLGDAFFEEAADSDDVTGRRAAFDYLAARLEFFGDLIPAAAHAPIRERFIARWDGWERVG